MAARKQLYVLKRDGREEEVHFDKITSRIKKLCYNLDMDFIEPVGITMKVISGLYPGVTTVELDNLAAEVCAYLATKHPDYETLAARIAVSNLHKETKAKFSEAIEDLYNLHMNERHLPMISKETYDIIMENSNLLDKAIVNERDFEYTYFGFKTLERSYLLKIGGKPVERPQYLLMRVAIGIHGRDIDAALKTYTLLSEKWFTHATPTLFNAGTNRPQLSSCFLLSMKEDSIEGIYDTLKQCALISKSAGGIGLAIHCIRASGSYISGTNGESNGLLPMLRVFNSTASYVDQGGNKVSIPSPSSQSPSYHHYHLSGVKVLPINPDLITEQRPGAFAMYLEPWHADIFDFLNCRKNTGVEEKRTRDLFYALWTPDLFMERVEADADWTLMSPNECPGLHQVWGDEFKELYQRYEREGRGRKVVKAQKLWHEIVTSQIETGTPYMLYKDACNRKSNQQNLGTIVSSNLCTEVVQYSDANEVAVCNLASIALNRFVRDDSTFDFEKLKEVVGVAIRNLNKIIDVNYYPIPEARRSNLRHRPIGLGVQGLADTFILMRYPFDSPEARTLNRDIFETIYFAALGASCRLAEQLGTYETYKGSPVSRGVLQPDMWGVVPSERHDWAGLREQIKRHGVRNSLLVAPMPTASTAQILGNCESIEAYTTNIYTRRVLSGDHQVVNHHLLKDLMKLGLWDADMKNTVMANNGSIQGIECIPADVRALYKTAWEIPQKVVIDLAADRGPYIDQSQSLNIYMAEPNYRKVTSMHFYGWKKGLKTGMYYLRTKAAVDPIKITVSKLSPKNRVGSSEVNGVEDTDGMTCSRLNKEACTMCSG